MKKSVASILAIVLCLLSICVISFAESMHNDRFAPILDAWNASNGDELWQHVWEYYTIKHPDDDRHPSSLAIRIGGDTDELIRDKNWDLAIVSSRKVNLQKLAEASILKKRAHVPSQSLALSQWLSPESVQCLLPNDPIWIYYIYCYDYDPVSDDATLLLCHSDNVYDIKDSSLCAEILMETRTTDLVRKTEGLVRVGWTTWTTDDLLQHPDKWDIATVAVKTATELNGLDQYGLLMDLSQYPYWATRTKEWNVPNGFFSSDGRMIAIPYDQYANLRPDETLALVINAHCANPQRVMEYAIHWMKSYEWMYDRATQNDTPAEHRKKYGISLYKYDMDW